MYIVCVRFVDRLFPTATLTLHPCVDELLLTAVGSIPIIVGERYPWHSVAVRVTRGRRKPGFKVYLPTCRWYPLYTRLRVFFLAQRQVMGKTLLDPKKDSKWERGRTRQALHFGAHVRGGKVVGAEVRPYPCT